MLFSPCSACLLVEYAENLGIETIAAWNIREWTHTHWLLHQVCVPVPYHLGGMGMGLLTWSRGHWNNGSLTGGQIGQGMLDQVHTLQ